MNKRFQWAVGGGLVAAVLLLALGAGTIDDSGIFQSLKLGGGTNLWSATSSNLTVSGSTYPSRNLITNQLGIFTGATGSYVGGDAALHTVQSAQTNETFGSITGKLAMTITGQSLVQATPTTSFAVSNFTANTLLMPPVPWTQTTTNLVLDLGAGGWQTNTATADVHVTCSNIAAGRIVTLDIWAGTTNRNLTFDTPLTNWFSAVPSIISSNHIMRLSFMPPDDQTNHITLAAAQSFP